MRKGVVGSALGGVVAGVVVALIALNVFAPAAPASTTPSAPNMLGGSVGVKLVIQVHRADGTTQTYVKEGDLVLLNFARLLVKATRGASDPDGDDDLVYSNGGTYGDYYNVGNGVGQIWLGNSTSPVANINDYNFNAPIKFNIQDADFIINGNNITIDIFGSYTVDTAFNVTEVGLSGCVASLQFLYFHDALQTPIQLNAGDGITVHYYIYISNPS